MNFFISRGGHLTYLEKDKKNWSPKDQFPVEVLSGIPDIYKISKVRINMTTIVSQSIAYFTKISHLHRIQVAFESKDIANFIIHFLYLRVDKNNECIYEKPITGIIAGLTGWSLRSISNAMSGLAAEGEFERFKTKGMSAKAVRLNYDIANRQRWGLIKSNYTGKNPVYSEKQIELADKLKPFIEDTRWLYPGDENGEDEMSALIAKVDELSTKLNDVMELLKAMVNKEPGAEQKAECHLKLIDGGME